MKPLRLIVQVVIICIALSYTQATIAQKKIKGSCSLNTRKSLDKGVDYYLKRVSHDSTRLADIYHLSMCYYKLRDFRSAIHWLDKIIAVDPAYPSAFSNRGICKLFLKDESGACADLRQSVLLGEDDSSTFGNEKTSVWLSKHCTSNH